MVRSGSGVHLSSDGMIYMGFWENDQMNGEGRLQFASGAEYVGTFVNNSFHGKGRYTWANGSYFDGIFENNRFLSFCCYLFTVMSCTVVIELGSSFAVSMDSIFR